MNNVQFYETRMGHDFFMGQLPKLIKTLDRIANALEEQNKRAEEKEKNSPVNSPVLQENKTYDRILVIEHQKAERIRYLLEHEPKTEKECMPEDEVITYTADFGNGFEMDVKICGVQYQEGQDNLPWTEAVLFYEGEEIACSEPSENFFGVWGLQIADGKLFRVFIEDEAMI